MKTYMKPALEVREIRVSENIASSLWDNAVWTRYNMLGVVGSGQTPTGPSKVAELVDLSQYN